MGEEGIEYDVLTGMVEGKRGGEGRGRNLWMVNTNIQKTYTVKSINTESKRQYMRSVVADVLRDLTPE